LHWGQQSVLILAAKLDFKLDAGGGVIKPDRTLIDTPTGRYRTAVAAVYDYRYVGAWGWASLRIADRNPDEAYRPQRIVGDGHIHL
jgi:hypothetical protein